MGLVFVIFRARTEGFVGEPKCATGNAQAKQQVGRDNEEAGQKASGKVALYKEAGANETARRTGSEISLSTRQRRRGREAVVSELKEAGRRLVA
jgi:hypothetical protein